MGVDPEIQAAFADFVVVPAENVVPLPHGTALEHGAWVEESGQRLVLVSEVGSRLPAYATGLGNALLSGLPDEEVARRFEDVPFERFTDTTIPSLDAFLDELDAGLW